MRIKVNRLFKYREIAGEYYLIPIAEAAEKWETPLRLTETAAWIWSAAEAEKSMEEIKAELTEEFEVDRASAGRAVDTFLYTLFQKGLIEISAD